MSSTAHIHKSAQCKECLKKYIWRAPGYTANRRCGATGELATRCLATSKSFTKNGENVKMRQSCKIAKESENYPWTEYSWVHTRLFPTEKRDLVHILSHDVSFTKTHRWEIFSGVLRLLNCFKMYILLTEFPKARAEINFIKNIIIFIARTLEYFKYK